MVYVTSICFCKIYIFVHSPDSSVGPNSHSFFHQNRMYLSFPMAYPALNAIFKLCANFQLSSLVHILHQKAENPGSKYLKTSMVWLLSDNNFEEECAWREKDTRFSKVPPSCIYVENKFVGNVLPSL